MRNNQKGFGIFEALFVILIFSLLAGSGWYIYQRQTGPTKGSSSVQSYKTVLGHRIALVDCSKLKSKIEKQQKLDGDICYVSPITVNGETFQYVIVDQSAQYKENIQKEYDKNCTMDCGGGLPLTGAGDFIIRANGEVEIASTDWTGSASTALEYLTGCTTGSLEKYAGKGEFTINHGRVGVHFAASNIDYSEQYGSSCNIAADLIAYTSIEKPALTFKNIAVKYALADPSSCASKNENDSQANSDSEQCYTDQAGMRGDIGICDKTYFAGTGTDSSDCIHAVATRTRNTAICQKTFKNDIEECMNLVNEAKSYFSGSVIATGL